MRAPIALLTLALALATAVGCDDYGAVQQEDTIEAYERYLAENPDSSNAFTANIRLEELYLDKARKEATLEAYDAYLARWPEGIHTETAHAERESMLYTRAQREGTAQAWRTFLEEYPKAKPRQARTARRALEAAEYVEAHMTIGPIASEKVNLAEDPQGPLNGTRFSTAITHDGERTVASLWFRLFYLNEQGGILDTDEWPLVAPYAEFPVPVPEAQTLPMAPGETRTWEWSTGDLPERFSGEVRIRPYKIRFADDAPDGEAE